MKKLFLLLALMMPMMAFADMLYEDSTKLTKEAMFDAVKQKIESGKNSTVTYSIKETDARIGEIYITWEKKDCAGWGKHWLGNLKGEVLVQVYNLFFRVTSMDGMVSYKLKPEYENLSAASPEDRKTMVSDLANVHRIFPDEQPTFNTNVIDYTLKVAEKKLAESPKYLKPKDEEKGKVNPMYTEASLYFNAYDGMNKDLNASLQSIVDDVVAAIGSLK